MMLSIAGTGSGMFLAQLVIAATRTVALAAITGLVLVMFRAKGPSVRLLAWTGVLYAGLIMPVLSWLLPPLPVRIPLLQSQLKANVAGDELDSVVRKAPSVSIATVHAGTETGNVSGRPHGDNRSLSWTTWASSIRWTTFASGVYLVVALFLFSRLLIGLKMTSRLVRESKPIHDSRITVWLSTRVNLVRRRLLPRVCESELVSVPLTTGVFAPTIILPIAWCEWDEAKLDAVLSHEISHVARWDSLSQYLSLLHRAIFWFSPLAWWLHRQMIDLAEQVSDEAVLSSGAERNEYARTLLGFLQTAQTASRRVRWQGVSMASSTQAEKRLERILAWRGVKTVNGKRWALVIVAMLALPAAYLIAAGSPVQGDQSAQNSNGRQEMAFHSNPPAVPTAPVASESPAAPEALAAPEAPASPAKQTRNHGHRYFYSYGPDDEQRFVIVSGKTDALTMSGSDEDARHAEKLRRRISGDFIWFQRDEKSYIIRDQATVERARQLWAPQEELGKKQEELGKQQEALGKQQEELGARMEKVQVQVPDMTAELDKLKAELKQLGPSATMEQMGHLQSEIGDLQSKIGEIQSHAGEQQGKLGEEMGALGEKQGKLGAQQGELGRQQGELAEKATREMKQLLDDSIKKGIAQPESPELSGSML
jgi:beta-lactamase regulating signal transducer with metallopeptidase domain